MAEARSKLQPQSPYWYEDLCSPMAALEAGDKHDRPDPGLDVHYVDANILQLSRVSSIQRGFGLMFGVGISIGFVVVLPFLVEIYTNGRPQEAPIMASFLMVMLLVLVVLLIHTIKRAIRTPLDLPVLFDRKKSENLRPGISDKAQPVCEVEDGDQGVRLVACPSRNRKVL